MSSTIYPPYARRTVDNVLVLQPRYYADPGPEGFYPELQWPVQTRLGVKFHPEFNKSVYYQLNAVFVRDLRINITKEEIRNYLSEISREIIFTCFQKHGSRNEMIACLEFSSPKDADDAIIFFRSHSHLFSDSRLLVRYSDIHARDWDADPTRNILLVREELALSPPYTPRSLHLPLTQHYPPFAKGKERRNDWNAVGYSRDHFQSKRSAPTDWQLQKSKRRVVTDFHFEEKKLYPPTGPARRFSTPVQDRTRADRRANLSSCSRTSPLLSDTIISKMQEGDNLPKSLPTINDLSRPDTPEISTALQPLTDHTTRSSVTREPAKLPEAPTFTFPYNITRNEFDETLKKLQEIASKISLNINAYPGGTMDYSAHERDFQNISKDPADRDITWHGGGQPVEDNEQHNRRHRRNTSRSRGYSSHHGERKRKRSPYFRDEEYSALDHYEGEEERPRYWGRDTSKGHGGGHGKRSKRDRLSRQDLKGFLHHFKASPTDCPRVPEPKYIGISEDGKYLIFGSRRDNIERACSSTHNDAEKEVEHDCGYKAIKGDVHGKNEICVTIISQNKSKADLEIDLSSEEEIEEIEDERFRLPKPHLFDNDTSAKMIVLSGSEEGKIVEPQVVRNNETYLKVSDDKGEKKPSSGMQFSKNHESIQSEQTRVTVLPVENDQDSEPNRKKSTPDFRSKVKIYRINELSSEILDLLGIELRYTFKNQDLLDRWKERSRSNGKKVLKLTGKEYMDEYIRETVGMEYS